MHSYDADLPVIRKPTNECGARQNNIQRLTKADDEPASDDSPQGVTNVAQDVKSLCEY